MSSASARPRRFLVAALLITMLSATWAGVVGQAGGQDPPLFRSDPDSSVAGASPAVVLASDPPMFVRGDQAIPLSYNYKCTTAPATSNPPLHPNCDLGAQGANAVAPRTVTVQFTLNGTDPGTTNGHHENQTLTQQGSLNPPPHNDEIFSGAIPLTALADVEDGDILAWRVRVPTAQTSAFGSTIPPCNGTNICFDPKDTTGQATYKLRMDVSTPWLLVTDPANANVFNLTENQWYLYSNESLSNHLPTITITTLDNFTGSPLDVGRTQFLRNNTANTTVFVRASQTTHSATYQYDYTRPGGRSFNDNTATEIDVRIWDQVGHQLDTANRSNNPALWIIMDVTPPVIDQENSTLERAPGETGLASLGENLEVHINATDFGANNVNGGAAVNTPRQFLNVTVQLMGGPGNATRSPTYNVPYNATLGYHFSDNITIPTTWVTGRTYANVTVRDPVGQNLTDNITGFVNVDVDLPTITPLAPFDTSQGTGFSGNTQNPFRIIAADTGDADSWNGASTQDTDGIGVRHSSVKMYYKIGAEGALSSVTLAPQQADHTFAATRNFNSNDRVYFYFEAQDFAGNTVSYPGPDDPGVPLNTTANDGLFLLLVVDQAGPVITEAKDHDYLGVGPHEVRVRVTDEGAGVNPDTVSLFWRLQGESSYREVEMTQNTTTNGTGAANTTFVGLIPTQTDGARVQWYIAATDLIGNEGRLGTVNNPNTAIIDLTPPTVSVTAPPTSPNAIFNVTWAGSDTGSGIDDFTLQFRIAPGGNWFTVPSRTNTQQQSYEVCAAAGRTYEFRVSARDRAGNERAFPQAADARTDVTATTSCAQPAEVVVTSPAAGSTLSGTTQVAWSAVSTTFPEGLTVRISVGQGNNLQAIATGLANTGSFSWNTAATAASDTCFADGSGYVLRVSAIDPNGLEGSATVQPLTLSNGIDDCQDRDNDGLLDAWEFANFDNLGQGPSGDPDGDGFSNLDELRAGTDPASAASRPGGTDNNPGGGGGDAAGWNDLYILVILAFLAVLGVFVVGITRRW